MRKTLGIVGGGQLALMLGEAARTLGIATVVLDPTPDAPASKVARQVVGDFRDTDTVLAFSKEADVLTFEIESANAEALQELSAKGYPVEPAPETLAIIKDKLAQKQFLEARNIPTAPFIAIETEADVARAGEVLGYPFVLKARSGGYDGRGNATVKGEADVEDALKKLSEKALYAEAFVPFEKELAVVAVRSIEGEIRTYPVVETIHENHICTEVLMPAPVPHEVAEKAEALAGRILEAFSGAGVFGIEMFLSKGEVLINEIAPRVHNSGHVTIEACKTSQFENHVRAVVGLPLGDTSLIVPSAVMINILGEREGAAHPEGVEEAESLGASVHLYGKKDTKRARKMGHLTMCGEALEEVQRRAREARARVSI